MDFTHARIGFRIGQPKVKLLIRGWDKVLEKMKAVMPTYVRTVEEPAKDKLIADREVLGEKLKAVGLSVVQDETFFIEPKVEEVAA